MEKYTKTYLRSHMIGSALIWASALIGCALILKDNYTDVAMLLAGAAAVHQFIWSSLSAQLKKQEGSKDHEPVGCREM